MGLHYFFDEITDAFTVGYAMHRWWILLEVKYSKQWVDIIKNTNKYNLLTLRTWPLSS